MAHYAPLPPQFVPVTFDGLNNNNNNNNPGFQQIYWDIDRQQMTPAMDYMVFSSFIYSIAYSAIYI